MDHDHTWMPIPLNTGGYDCACGATGYRQTWGPQRGQVVAHKTPRARPASRESAPHAGRVSYDGHARAPKRNLGD